MGVLFACGACGSPAVEPPRAFVDSAEVRCRRCGQHLGTWGALKQRTKRLIRTELRRQPTRVWACSSDPLPSMRGDGQDRDPGQRVQVNGPRWRRVSLALLDALRRSGPATVVQSCSEMPSFRPG